MCPEYSPSELEAMRLKRDIAEIVRLHCQGEDEYENTAPIKARKTKPKKAPKEIPPPVTGV